MRFRVLQSCPAHLKAKHRVALTTALEAVREAAQRRDPVKEVRAWKLFSLLPFWLLRRPLGQGRVGKAELSDRFELFAGGQWESLHGAATRDTIRNKESDQHRTYRNPCCTWYAAYVPLRHFTDCQDVAPYGAGPSECTAGVTPAPSENLGQDD